MAQRTRRRVTARAVIGIASIGVASVAAIGSAATLAAVVLVARVVITPPRRRAEDIRILAVGDETIAFAPNKDTTVDGMYSLWFDEGSGHAKIGRIVSETPDEVVRELLHVDYGDISKADRGRWAGWVYLDPADLGVDFTDELIMTQLGEAPAWLVHPQHETGRWVIQVHGRGVRRSEGLRAIPVFRDAGYTSLLISYRNDGDAPASSDGRYALGDMEWHDVDAAIAFAIERGATQIVLMGWSMGGATVLQTAMRSRHSAIITGLVLESPVVDWVTALQYQGAQLGLAAPLQNGVLTVLSRNWSRRLTGQTQPIDLARLNFVHRAGELRLPILLVHSADDGFVPVTASRELAVARPDIVTYEEFTVARHTKLWNYDRERWNTAIRTWLSLR